MSFGELDFGAGWIIPKMAPHVSMRFKAMFGGIRAGQTPPFYLRDTPDRAADLDWFMQRYPLDLTDRARDALGRGLGKYRDQRAKLEALRTPDYRPPDVTGFREGEQAHSYQARAAELWRTTGRLLLLDDVGLGKTVSALAGLSGGWGLPAAIVVQPHLSSQWVKDYIERFTHLRAVEVKASKPYDLPPADIYVFRYTQLAGWADMPGTLGIRSVVFDEIQELRHGEGTAKGRGAAAFCAAADNRLGLTATPIYNYGSEIFHVVEFIAPGALGSWMEFVVNWCHQNGSHWVVTDPAALGAFLVEEGIALRRTCEDAEVAMTLPPQSKMLVEVGWNEGDAESDRDLQRRLAQRVLSGHYLDRGQAARELDLMVRHETGVAKARAVAAYVRTLVEAGEPVLLGGWHRAVYDIWMETLADLRPAMFTGSESQAQKKRAKATFMSGETDLLIMSLRSGAGLDGLQARCCHAVAGELDWSPQVHVQFTGRLARQGQTRPVTAHFLHVEGGSDPVIMSMLGLKASQSHGILNPFGGGDVATPVNETRMRQLAKALLEKEATDA